MENYFPPHSAFSPTETCVRPNFLHRQRSSIRLRNEMRSRAHRVRSRQTWKPKQSREHASRTVFERFLCARSATVWTNRSPLHRIFYSTSNDSELISQSFHYIFYNILAMPCLSFA